MTHTKIALLSLFVLLTYSFTVEQQQVKTKMQLTAIEHPSNLGFMNQKGPNTTSAQVSSFINFINSASALYPDSLPFSVETRLTYISDKMNEAYGQEGKYGFTVIRGGNTWTFSSSFNSYGVYASVAAGVDLIFPDYSYMFIKDSVFSNGRSYIYNKGIGSGIDYDLGAKISNAIIGYEISAIGYCPPSVIQNIQKALVQIDNKKWNVFCSGLDDLSAVMYSDSNRYTYTQPYYWYFLMYST